MGTHFEGANASNAMVEWAKPLEEVGDDRLAPGKYAITIASESVYVIEGSVADLYTFASNVMSAASSIAEHASRPLGYNDFEVDEDGFYPCPRCERVFEPRTEDSLMLMVNAIDAHIASHRPEHEQ